MKDCNVYFSDTAQGWVLEVRLRGTHPYSPEWTNIATFSDRKSAIAWFKEHY
jgi:hypothetical protein